MQVFRRSLGELILAAVVNSPAKDVENYVKENIKEFLRRPRTTKELYEYCDYIANHPCSEIGQHGEMRIVVGDISGFIKSLCNVKPFYAVPPVDDAELVNLRELQNTLSRYEEVSVE